MTVSTSIGRQFTVNQLVTLAFKRAGLKELSETCSESELRYGRDVLELLFDRMPNDGPAARVQDFLVVELTAGQSVYTVESRVVDFLDVGMFIRADQPLDNAEGELLVNIVDQRTWQRFSSKAASGTPTMFYPHRVSDPIEVYLWPVPDETGARIRFRVHRALADVADGNSTIDLESTWNEWVVLALASKLATSSSMGTQAASLRTEADIEFRRARGQANHKGPERMVLDHMTSWRAR